MRRFLWITTGAIIALQVAVTGWVALEWASATGLGRGIAWAILVVSLASLALSGLPAAILLARGRRPLLALSVSLAFPLVWALVMWGM